MKKRIVSFVLILSLAFSYCVTTYAAPVGTTDVKGVSKDSIVYQYNEGGL